MMKQTFSEHEIESRKADGWIVVKEHIITGKLRTAEMIKDDDPTAWIAKDAKIRASRRDRLSRSQIRIASHKDYLRHRGHDV